MPVGSWYGWRIPDRGEVLWFSQLARLWGEIDTTVHSVDLVTNARMMLVVSAMATQSFDVTVSTTNANGSWTVCSFDPGGPIDGFFTIQRSGANCLLQFEHDFSLRPVATPPTVTPTFAFRLVVNPGSLVLGTASSFLFRGGNRPMCRMTGQWVGSLGAGVYATELQVRGFIPGGVTNCGTTWGQGPGWVTRIWATEQRS